MSKCTECGFEMTSGARRCGHCGVQYVEDSSTGPIGRIMGALQGAAVSGFAFWLARGVWNFSDLWAIIIVPLFAYLGYRKGFTMTIAKK